MIKTILMTLALGAPALIMQTTDEGVVIPIDTAEISIKTDITSDAWIYYSTTLPSKPFSGDGTPLFRLQDGKLIHMPDGSFEARSAREHMLRRAYDRAGSKAEQAAIADDLMQSLIKKDRNGGRSPR